MRRVPDTSQFLEHFDDPLWLDVARELFEREGVRVDQVKRDPAGESIVILGDDRYVLKIYRPWKSGFRRESDALERLKGHVPVNIPEIVADGKLDGYKFLITTAITGRLLTRAEWLTLERSAQIDLIAQLAEIFQALHALEPCGMKFDWPAFVARNAAGAVERQRSEGGDPEWIASLPDYIERNLPLVATAAPHVFLHGDVHFGNLRIVEKNGRPQIAGLFDFADSLRGSHEYDFIAPGVLMFQGQGDLQREFFRRYGYPDADINEQLRRRMMMLTILYEWSSLRRYAERLSPEAVSFTLEGLERAIWNFA